MKKSKWTAMILGTLLTASLLCFSACNPQQTEEQDPSIPDMAWGGSVSDTLKALDTDTAALGEQAVLDEATGAGNAVVMGAELFGQKTEGVVLGFDGTEDGKGAFRQAVLYYPDNADMEKVLDELKKQYGEPAKSLSLTDSTGNTETLTTADGHQYWGGEAIGNKLDDSQKKALREKLDSSKPDIVKGLDDSQWESYLKNPSVTVHWSTDFQSVLEQNAAEKLPDSIKTSKNAVVLNARYLLEAESVK